MGNPLVYPTFSILDPETTFSLPPRQIANGIADAFTHVMEQYMTYPVDAQIQDRFAESIIQTLIEVAPKTLENPTNYEARANFMWAATVALNGFISLGVPQDWATHQIGRELTAFHGIDHARSLAVVLPYLLKIKQESNFFFTPQLNGLHERFISWVCLDSAKFYDISAFEGFFNLLINTILEDTSTAISEQNFCIGRNLLAQLCNLTFAKKYFYWILIDEIIEH
jgi:alcohol dehydrogenase YqhD (iron-dependent ADH family)